jgi:8-oxo-dGTP pyrophosphatase MutT (NUDIX family)
MTSGLKKAWTELVQPMLRRPKRLQMAALCYTQNGPKKKVLLITSRDTGRWILPKGWPINGKDAPATALQEAWEEAGVSHGHVDEKSLGSYDYDKELDGGLQVPVETMVYSIQVTTMKDDFPEANQRRRKWVSPKKASAMVHEPELRKIIRNL